MRAQYYKSNGDKLLGGAWMLFGLFALTVLLLNMFSVKTNGCDLDPCPPCQYHRSYDNKCVGCDGVCDNVCDGVLCHDHCESEWSKCKACDSMTGECKYYCNPADCEECVSGFCIVCDNDPTQCCMNHSCKDRCGSDCCRDDQYCCGDELIGDQGCCNNGDLCCTDQESGGHFCSQPCEVYEIDCTSCSESQEELYKCPGCFNVPFLDGCANYTYRDYTGLIIQGCEYGCRHDMGYEPCYYEKRCVDDSMPEEKALCIDGGENGLVCVPDIDADGEDGTIGISCDTCGTGGATIDEYPRYTCRNCYDD